MAITSGPPSFRDSVGADHALRQAFTQVQAALAEAADVHAIPSNLDPPLGDAARELKAMASNGCLLAPTHVVQLECATGDLASPTRVALIGDSNAAMWAPALEEVAEQRHWRLQNIGKQVCPPMNAPIANPLRRLGHMDCEQWRADVMSRLRAERPKLVVVSMWRQYGKGWNFLPGYNSYDPAWIDSLTRLTKQLRDIGAKVLVLGPIPDPRSAVPTCLSGHLEDASACSPTRSAAVNVPGLAAEAAATEAGGGHYVDVTDLFCAANRCPVIVGNTLVYIDWTHMSAQYARLLAPAIEAIADRTLAGS